MKVRQVLLRCSFICFLIGNFSNSQTAPPGLQISPASIDFGENAVSSDGGPRAVSVVNPTQSTIALQQILTSGIDFSQENNCSATLAPQAQCTIQVSFTPAVSGPRAGSLQILGSDGGPHFVALTGLGKE